MVITAYGGTGHFGYTNSSQAGSGGKDGAPGEAQTTTTIATWEVNYKTPLLFYGNQGNGGGGGNGGSGIDNHGGGGGNDGVGGMGGPVHSENGPSKTMPWTNPERAVSVRV